MFREIGLRDRIKDTIDQLTYHIEALNDIVDDIDDVADPEELEYILRNVDSAVDAVRNAEGSIKCACAVHDD